MTDKFLKMNGENNKLIQYWMENKWICIKEYKHIDLNFKIGEYAIIKYISGSIYIGPYIKNKPTPMWAVKRIIYKHFITIGRI